MAGTVHISIMSCFYGTGTSNVLACPLVVDAGGTQHIKGRAQCGRDMVEVAVHRHIFRLDAGQTHQLHIHLQR